MSFNPAIVLPIGYNQESTEASSHTNVLELIDRVDAIDRPGGCAFDGVQDDTAALSALLSAGVSFIDGRGRTCRVSGPLVGLSDVTIKDLTLDFTSLATGAAGLSFSGTDGTAQTLASDLAANVWSVSVPDATAFTIGDLAFLQSNAYWSSPSGDNVKCGELVQIANLSSDTLYFTGTTLLAYATADGATITPITPVRNVTLDNVNLLGPVSTGNQVGVSFNRALNCHIIRGRSTNWDFTHTRFQRSSHCSRRGGSAWATGVQEGLDYGVAILEGCRNITVSEGFTGALLRHVVTHGGSVGVNRFTTVFNCFGHELTDAGLDAHSAVAEHAFIGNHLHFSDNVDVTIDGILTSGTNAIVQNNFLYNPKRHGVYWQPEPQAVYTGPVDVSIEGNECYQFRASATSVGVYVAPSATIARAIDSIRIGGNKIHGFGLATRIQTVNGQPFKQVTIDGLETLTPCPARCVYVWAAAGDIQDLQISGGMFATSDATTAAVVELIATSPYYIRNWRVTGARLRRGAAGTVGLKLTRCLNGREAGIIWDNTSVPYSVDTESTMVLDLSNRGPSTYSASTSYTLGPADRAVTFNRAATVTITLPAASQYPGRLVTLKTVQAQAVVASASVVAPIDSLTLGTAILPATAGAWAQLESNGTDWIITARGT